MRITAGLALAAAAAVVPALRAQTIAELTQRRAAVQEALEPGQVIILRGRTGEDRGSGFRQDSNFFYLTGQKHPGGALLLDPERIVLFGDRARRGRSVWNAPRPGLESAGKVAGIANLKSMRALQAEEEHIAEKLDLTLLSGTRTRAIINRLRRFKSPSEVASLTMAIKITCAAQREAMRAAKPGMYEYQLQAIIEHVFRFNGADKVGFKSILGSGPNSCILHWSKNNRRIEDGDVVVMDVGGEYGMYTADVTRTIPINGKFSKRQREIYEIVLAANKAGIAMVKPGVRFNAINAKVNEILMEGLVKVGLAERRSRAALRKYYYHGLGHALGLAVHDVGGLGKLEAGMVLTIEPGLYIRGEEMGFRIEDDIVVTEDGHVVLSASAPKEVADIEALMAEDGIDTTRYTVKRPGGK